MNTLPGPLPHLLELHARCRRQRVCAAPPQRLLTLRLQRGIQEGLARVHSGRSRCCCALVLLLVAVAADRQGGR